MLRAFKIKNFRCFKHFEINDLNRINLIAGKNNVGKTALLEAIFLFFGSYNPELVLRINAFRGIEIIKIELSKREHELPWNTVFYDFDPSNDIYLSGDNKITERELFITTKIEREDYQAILSYIKPIESIGYQILTETNPILKMTSIGKDSKKVSYLILSPQGTQLIPFPPYPSPLPAIFLGSKIRVPPLEDAERFSELAKMKKQGIIIEALKTIEPLLKDLTILTLGGIPVLHGDLGTGRLVPLPLMGEGMVKIASITLAIATAKNGVVLIDEFENGLHHSILTEVWKIIAKVARDSNCQIFATTHSFECISSAFSAFSENEIFDFRFYRLEKIEDQILAISYDKESLQASLEIGLEVR